MSLKFKVRWPESGHPSICFYKSKKNIIPLASAINIVYKHECVWNVIAIKSNVTQSTSKCQQNVLQIKLIMVNKALIKGKIFKKL